MGDYIPLQLPTIAATPPPDYAATATFLAESAEALVASGNSFLQSLTDLKAIDFSQVGDLARFPTVVLPDVTLSAIGARPTRPVIDVNVQALLDRLLALTQPNAPPVNTFSYTDPGYVSSLRDPLINKLLMDLVNGGYGIDINDEIALYNRERDRENLTTQANIEEAKRTAASTSFPMPQGSLYAALQRARQDSMAKNSSVNRDIMLNRTKLYVENRQFIIEKVLATEAQSIDLYTSIQNRAVEVGKTQVSLAIAIYESGLKFFQYQIDVLYKQISAKLDIAKMQISVYGEDIRAYAAFVNAVSVAALMTVREAELGLDAAKARQSSLVDIVRFRLQQLIATVENSKDINKYGTEFFRTALGATMNGINGLAVQTGTV